MCYYLYDNGMINNMKKNKYDANHLSVTLALSCVIIMSALYTIDWISTMSLVRISCTRTPVPVANT